MKFGSYKIYCPEYHIAPLVLSGLVSAGSGLIGQGINFFSQKKANDANVAAQQANLDYQKAVQQQTWQREDTAWQRAIADIQKTGMSPLALSGGAGSGQVVSTSAVQSSAPQIDAGAMANSAANVTAAIQADKQLKLQTKQMENTVKQQEIENKMKQAEFEQMKLQFDKDYNLRAKGQEEGFKLDWQRIANEIARDAEQTRQFDKKLEHDDAVFQWNKSQADKMYTLQEKMNTAQVQAMSDEHRKKIFEEEFRDTFGYDPSWNIYNAGAGVLKNLLDGIHSAQRRKQINDYKHSNGGGHR